MADLACRPASTWAHPSHVSWPHRELHRRRKWQTSHAARPSNAAHASHVPWPHREQALISSVKKQLDNVGEKETAVRKRPASRSRAALETIVTKRGASERSISSGHWRMRESQQFSYAGTRDCVCLPARGKYHGDPAAMLICICGYACMRARTHLRNSHDGACVDSLG